MWTNDNKVFIKIVFFYGQAYNERYDPLNIQGFTPTCIPVKGI